MTHKFTIVASDKSQRFSTLEPSIQSARRNTSVQDSVERGQGVLYATAVIYGDGVASLKFETLLTPFSRRVFGATLLLVGFTPQASAR